MQEMKRPLRRAYFSILMFRSISPSPAADFIQTIYSPRRQWEIGAPSSGTWGSPTASCRCSYFRCDGESGRTESNRLGLPDRDTLGALAPFTIADAALRRCSMDSDNHPFAGVSYHQHPGPKPFPIPREPAHFPDVPPVPAVKCQYGTYPRTKASLVRQRRRVGTAAASPLFLPPPALPPSRPG